MTPKYRPDIDGLRAIAVLSVLLFHAGIQYFSGGYIGVDIFFVISGYLITSIIVREIESDHFSIVRFYERRFRRILPALTAVVAISLFVGVTFLNPTTLVSLGKSVVATSLFSSNILFCFESGYFDATSALKPLLHTWTLAVEEQFYIFSPILLIAIAKMDSKNYAKWLMPLALFSLAACILGMEIKPSATFYLVPTRAWEFLIGSALVIGILPITRQQEIRNFLSFIGIALIGFSIFSYTPDTNFPGIAATIPTFGTALIIYAGIGGETFIGKILSLRPIVFIGLISYSLYLWHWPILVYTKYYYIKELTNVEKTIMLGAIFLLSILSWQYIEKPFREKKLLARRNDLFKAVSATSAMIVCIGFGVVLMDGLPNRYINDPAHENTVHDDEWTHWASCEDVKSKINNNRKLCNLGIGSTQASFIFWGDSHARALASAVDSSAKSHGLTGKIATESACPPLMSIERPNRHSCYDFNEIVFQYISHNPDIKTVILAARWALSTNGTRYKEESGPSVKLLDVKSSETVNMTNTALFRIGLTRTIDKLQELGKTVVLVSQIPEIGYDVPSSNFIASITGRDVNSMISPSLNEYRQRTEKATTIFTSMKKDRSVKIIDPSKYLCDDERCNVIANGDSLYRDDDHLSTFGSKFISHSFDGLFAEIASKGSIIPASADP